MCDDFSIENDGTNGELPSYLKCLDDDVEWRSLTQEEESLTQEEESLKREIEEVHNFTCYHQISFLHKNLNANKYKNSQKYINMNVRL